jgi:hypothetical protein
MIAGRGSTAVADSQPPMRVSKEIGRAGWRATLPSRAVSLWPSTKRRWTKPNRWNGGDSAPVPLDASQLC